MSTGAMCMAYSGRCLLSNFMTSRDSNRGACSHPCRWNYALMEEKRPGEFFPVYENERGSFVFNSKDLCMIAHLPELIKTGVKSLKIEGRVKSEYYVATVVKAYRNALDDYYRNPQDYRFNPKYYDEVCKVSHRDYHTGFFFGRKGETDTQIYNTSSYIREYDIVGMVQSYDENTRLACVEQRNRFFSGDEIEILQPSGPVFSQKAEPIWDENMQQIDAAPHPQMRLYLKMQQPVEVNSILRMRKKDFRGKRTD